MKNNKNFYRLSRKKIIQRRKKYNQLFKMNDQRKFIIKSKIKD